MSQLKAHTKPVYRRLLPFAAATGAALSLAPAAQAATFKVRAHFLNHTPVVNRKWPLVLDVTRGRERLSGNVRYEFLYQGQVVSHQPGHRFKHGVYRDTMKFPANSLGEPLTLRVIVTVPHMGTEHIDWAIHSKR
jgi:hypothetical protein